jgi:hypothetical protein
MLQRMMLSRRSLLQGIAASSLAGGLARPAGATTALAVSLPELIGRSRYALVGTATNASSRWETLGDSRRIVTYFQVTVQHPIDGRPTPDTSVMVRTLGGRVGNIGQLVHGEARLELDAPAVLFLTQGGDGLFNVTAMAQGQYPLYPDTDAVQRLHASPNMPELFRRSGSAVEQLVQKSVLEAETLVSDYLHKAR